MGKIILKEDPEGEIAAIALSDPPFRAVEIGFGNGEFLEHLALSRPEGVFFGIEVSLQCLIKALKRIQRSGCGNVRILKGDARFILGECFPQQWLDAVYMNFPCPWPKSRHAKRRVTYSGFADVLAGSLREGGIFELFTDDKNYASEVEQQLPDHPALSLEVFYSDPERCIHTKYERKWREMGKELYLLRFIKRIPFYSENFKKEERELHASLERVCPEFPEVQSLNEIEGGESSNRWVFKDSYMSGSGVVLVETITSDEGFRQSFFIKIVPRREGCLVKLDAPSRPFMTPAVSSAFDHIVAFIMGR